MEAVFNRMELESSRLKLLLVIVGGGGGGGVAREGGLAWPEPDTEYWCINLDPLGLSTYICFSFSTVPVWLLTSSELLLTVVNCYSNSLGWLKNIFHCTFLAALPVSKVKI